MATHQANIDNLRTATLGEQVRGSMIQLFEEDYNLVKRGINVGTAVTSASSSTAGYYDGNLYINSATLDVWECNGSVWIRQGNLKGIADITETISPVDGGVNTITITLTDGTTKVLTVKNGETGADGANGVDGLSIADIELESSIGNAKTYKPVLSDGTKTPNGFTVTDGTSSYVHIRYSANFDGTGMVTVPTDATVYIGIVVTSQSVAPTDPSVYSWVRFIGKSGTGSGDMLAADYSTKYAGVVDKAAALYDGTNEIQANQLMDKTVYDADNDGIVDNAEHATNADNVGNADTSLLEKLSDSYGKLNYNGNALMLEAAQFANQAKLGEFTINQISNNVKELALHSDITTKLSKLDTTDNLSVELDKKIDKPASATDGQVLTYNGTSNEWEAQDSKGGITGRTRRDITSDLTNLPTAIAEQNLEKYGYTIGDYFVGASGYYYYLADMDTNYGGYNYYAVVDTHHCGIVVDTKSTCQWLASGSVTNYSSSTLHSFLTNTALPNIKSDIATLFGDWESHLLKRTELDNSIGGWGTVWDGLKDCLICAMTEVQMYGARVFDADGNQTGTGSKALELFRKYRFNEIYGNISIWLKSLVSASGACDAGRDGIADYRSVSGSSRASGLILFH